MISFELAKFILKFKNNMLPLLFGGYRQKSTGGYYHHPFYSEFERKRLQDACLMEWESIFLFKKSAVLLNLKLTVKQLFWSVAPKTLINYIILLN